MYYSYEISEENYPEIKELLKISFGKTYSLIDIENKYDTTSFGIKSIGVIAKNENNELAAYYGVFPIVLSYEDKDYLVAQSGDTMTAPNHQKKGLFTRLAKETYALAKNKGIKLIFGFPNKNSLPGFEKKLDWEFYGTMQRFAIKIKTLPLSQLTFKFAFFRPLYLKYLNIILKKYILDVEDLKFDSFNYSKVKGHIKKDRNFFHYKLKNKSNYVISINGFQMLIKISQHLFIGEIAKIDSDKIPELLKTLEKLSYQIGSTKCIFTLSKNHWLYNELISTIEAKESLPIGFYRIDNYINPQEIQFSHADYDTF